jgi:hypothetical protein
LIPYALLGIILKGLGSDWIGMVCLCPTRILCMGCCKSNCDRANINSKNYLSVYSCNMSSPSVQEYTKIGKKFWNTLAFHSMFAWYPFRPKKDTILDLRQVKLSWIFKSI